MDSFHRSIGGKYNLANSRTGEAGSPSRVLPPFTLFHQGAEPEVIELIRLITEIASSLVIKPSSTI
jgi:hypothetical protein